ncbi:MAG: nitrilase-related carbon-nitrogen hydrolase [Planctomycetota bacterium]
MVPIPTTWRILMFSCISLVLACIFFCNAWLNRRMSTVICTLGLPCGWVAFDLASSRLSPGGTWASIAYTFSDDLYLAQLASLGGWTAITFVSTWFAALVVWIWNRLHSGEQIRSGLVALAVVAVSVICYGFGRLQWMPGTTPIRIATVVAPKTFDNANINELFAYTRGIKTNEESRQRAQERILASIEEHFAMLESTLNQKPKMVLWPEANAIMTATEEPSFLQRASKFAKENDVYVGMGYVVFQPGTGNGSLNKFTLLSPNGEILIDFLKATRVPGSMNEKGDGILPAVDCEIGRLSAAICFDLDFPHLIAQAGAVSTELFLAPSNDWEEAQDTHARMARLRAIEQGFSLVRPTKDGTTLVCDSVGRKIASVNIADNRTGMLVVEVQPGNLWSVYSAIGDLFAWTCSIIFPSLCLVAGLRGRQGSIPSMQ